MMWDPGAGATRPTTRSETRRRRLALALALALMVLATIVAMPMASHTSSLDTDPSYFAYVFLPSIDRTNDEWQTLPPHTNFTPFVAASTTRHQNEYASLFFFFWFHRGGARHPQQYYCSAAGLLSGVAMHSMIIDSDTETFYFCWEGPGFLKGYVRRFAQMSHDHRGTPEVRHASSPDEVRGCVFDVVRFISHLCPSLRRTPDEW